MKERLVIKNFGPIKSVDLELGKMTILIGEQATGKSTIAKVLAVCRYFSYIIDDSESLIDYRTNFSRIALIDWGLDGFEKVDTIIQYKNEDYEVEIKHHLNPLLNENRLDSFTDVFLIPKIIAHSKKFKKLLEEYNKLKPTKKSNLGINSDWHIPHSFLVTEVKSVMNNPFFFPTERGLQSIFSIGKRGIENLNNRLYEQLAAINGITTNFKKETEIKLLGIHYKYENGQSFFKKRGSEEYYKLSQGASGFQSSIPIILAIEYYTEIEKRKRTFIIEEPEISLFPKTQKKLIEFFVENINVNGHSFLLPTHSPYFLSAVTDLLIAYRKGQKNPVEVEKIVKKESWLNPQDFSAYELRNGEAFDVFDKEMGLISDNIIDEASNEMEEEFDELLDIK